MDGTWLVAFVVVLVALVGAFAGYMVVVTAFRFWDGLGLSDGNVAQRHRLVPWIGAVIGAALALLGGYVMAFSGPS